jgi:hypothetical protein
MTEISKGKLRPFYVDWIAAAVFVLLLVFQPHQMAFYALRPSDGWLILCIILQYFNGYFNAISFKKRFLIEYFGLFIGLIAIVATLIQASYANITLDNSFIFNFYRFFRFLLIFKLIENIVVILGNIAIKKLLETLTITGLLVVVLSFLEFYGVEPFKSIIMSLYYARPESELESYLLEVDRLAGVLGNPNTTALLLLVSMIYPLAQLKNKKVSFVGKIVFITFLIAGTYVLLVMTGSRSSIITLIFIVVLFIIVTARNLREFLISFVLMVFLAAAGLFINKQLNRDSFAQERITDSFRRTNFDFTIKGFAVWTGRYELWNHRFRTFHNEGNQLALLIGLGYTVPDQDYADNGFVSTLINNGIIGLVLKFSLYFLFIFYGFRGTVRNYRFNRIEMINLVISLMAFALLMWELTADLTDHFKLGQLFYLLLSITMIQTSRCLIPSK